MKVRFKYNVWFLRKSYGMVLYPFVLFRQPKDKVSDRLFRHELEHVYQIHRDGWWRFHLKYLYEFIRYGYANISYERDARIVALEPLNDIEMSLKRAS